MPRLLIFLQVWPTENGNASWIHQAEKWWWDESIWLGFLENSRRVGIMEDLKCDTRCIFDIFRDFCDFRGSPSHAKAEVWWRVYFPRNSQNSCYEPILCKRTNNLNHALKHTGTHFRLRIKSQMFLFKTRSWRVKYQSLGQSPQMPTNLHISCTWESQWVSAHSFSQCISASQHTLCDSINKFSLSKGHTSCKHFVLSQEETDADYRKFSLTILFLNHTNCLAHLKDAFAI